MKKLINGVVPPVRFSQFEHCRIVEEGNNHCGYTSMARGGNRCAGCGASMWNVRC